MKNSVARICSYLRDTTLGVCFLAAACLTDASARAQDDWPRYAHDQSLTSRSPLKGRISQPKLAWSYSLRGTECEVEILPASGEQTLVLDSRDDSLSVTPRKIVPLQAPLLDLDGSGTLRPAGESYHERWAKILPGVKGWQRVAWSHTWTDQKVCRLQLFAYDQGFNAPRLVWQTEPPEETIFQPLNVIYDIDGDGVQEICVAAHYRIMIFEGTTGRKETELRYHQSRPYGWFGVVDVDGDGQVELVTIGDFQSHLDVLNYDPKKPEAERLSVRWRRDIEQKIEERRKWPQIGPRPVTDLDGDGRAELVLNLFNDTGDHAWHTVVLNAGTGALLHDFPKRFLQGIADLEANRKQSLLLTATDGGLVPAFGVIEVISFITGTPSVVWSRRNAAWGVNDLPSMGPTWSTTASQGMRTVLASEPAPNARPALFILERDSKASSPFPTALEAIRWDADRQASSLWRVEGLAGPFDLVACNGPAVSLRWSLPPGELRSTAAHIHSAEGQQGGGGGGGTPPSRADGSGVQGTSSSGTSHVTLKGRNARPQLVAHRAISGPLAPPVAARLQRNGPMMVMAEGAAQQMVAVRPPARGMNRAEVLWRRPGRGMGDGGRWLGPTTADLDGDGGNEVIAADQDVSGRAMLVAYRGDGSRLWEKTFLQTPGALPVWNFGALTFWWPGSFRSKGQTDLFVNTRRGLMHSDVGELLDGRTGRTIWKQEKAIIPGQFSWAYAGIPPGIADLDGDGLDELVSLYPVCFWIANGRTGELIQGVELASKKVLPAWAAYGEPMIVKLPHRPDPLVLLDSPYILAMLTTNGTPVWHSLGRSDYPAGKSGDHAGETTGVRHALADLDGDGAFEVASAGYGDGLRVMNGRDGRILWSLAGPAPTCPRVIAADIDGRGGDEILYVSGRSLIAVTGDRAAGKVLWTWQGTSELSMPVIADIDGDGSAEILLLAADGTLACVGGE